jgi:hypothetical protein
MMHSDYSPQQLSESAQKKPHPKLQQQQQQILVNSNTTPQLIKSQD